jgi:hypothetical protein
MLFSFLSKYALDPGGQASCAYNSMFPCGLQRLTADYHLAA